MLQLICQVNIFFTLLLAVTDRGWQLRQAANDRVQGIIFDEKHIDGIL